MCVITDNKLVDMLPVRVTLDSLARAKVPATVFSDVRIEPNDKSLTRAIDFARKGNFDGFVAVGGGSVIDTAKAGEEEENDDTGRKAEEKDMAMEADENEHQQEEEICGQRRRGWI